MATTIDFTASADFGQSGQYVARITGRNSKFTFEREFIGKKGGKRGDISSATVDDPGVYELRNATRKGKKDAYYFVGEFEGELHKLLADKEDAMVVAKALDARRAFGDVVRLSRNEPTPEQVAAGKQGSVVYEILSAAAAEKANAAESVESAVDLIVAALEVLGPKEQKAALAAVKQRLAPKVEALKVEAAASESEAS